MQTAEIDVLVWLRSDDSVDLDGLEALYKQLTATQGEAAVLVETDRANRTAKAQPSIKNKGTQAAQRQSQAALLAAYRQQQEHFDTNVATRLIELELDDRVLLLLQGAVLLHPRSRRVFARRRPLELLLQAIERKSGGRGSSSSRSAGKGSDKDSVGTTEQVRCTAVNTLVCCLADTPCNTRQLESLGGLARLAACFKAAGGSDRKLQLRLLEFFYFYLSDEGNGVPGALPAKEKQRLLEQHLDHVDALVEDLHLYRPFDLT